MDELAYNSRMLRTIWNKVIGQQATEVDNTQSDAPVNFDELEDELLLAHVNYQAASALVDVARASAQPRQAIYDYLLAQLTPLEYTIDWHATPTTLVMGVNGSGKTTSIAKLAHMLVKQNKRVMLAAGDTYRAAAIEQLQHWGQRISVPVVAHQQGADSAAVMFDALESARAKNIDTLLADTSGRLHTNSNLMRELERIIRVMQKVDNSAPQQTLLVCDATSGSNLLQQVEQFNQVVPISALVYTKTDVLDKCGAILSVAHAFKVPIAFLGTGEQAEQLLPFNAQRFVDALWG